MKYEIIKDSMNKKTKEWNIICMTRNSQYINHNVKTIHKAKEIEYTTYKILVAKNKLQEKISKIYRKKNSLLKKKKQNNDI